MSTLSLVLPGHAIPWNEVHMVQPYRAGKRWRAKFVTAPHARDVKSRVSDLVQLAWVDTDFWYREWKECKSFHVSAQFHGNYFWSNPWQRRSVESREKYRASWFYWPIHEALLWLGLRLGNNTPKFEEVIRVAKHLDTDVRISPLDVKETVRNYGRSARSSPFKVAFDLSKTSVLINSGWIEQMLKYPAHHLIRREYDLDALNKLIQDAIFESLKMSDALIDSYDLSRKHCHFEQFRRIVWTISRAE